MRKLIPLLVLALVGCSLDPNVTVQDPQVNVKLCLALVEKNGGVVEELVECEAGSSVPLDGGP
jgi:hypothetical protein